MIDQVRRRFGHAPRVTLSHDDCSAHRNGQIGSRGMCRIMSKKRLQIEAGGDYVSIFTRLRPSCFA